MSESVSDGPAVPAVVVADQQRHLDSLRYHQTVTTEPAWHHQYRADVNQNKTLLPHPHFPILQLPHPHPHPHHIGNITAALHSNIFFNYLPESESDCHVSNFPVSRNVGIPDSSSVSRDIFINYNISHYHNNILCLTCAESDQLRQIQQQQSENSPGQVYSETPQYGALPGDKSVGVRPSVEGGIILYNSHLIRQLRPSENLVCDV